MSQQFPAIPDEPSSDERLRATILACLAADSRLANAEIRVGVVNGIVHLAGMVATFVERATVEDLALQTPGVRGVVNRIDAPGAPSPGREIHLDLKNEKASRFSRRLSVDDKGV